MEKMTPLKTQISPKKSDVFLEKKWKSIFSQIFFDFCQKSWFYIILASLKKKW